MDAPRVIASKKVIESFIIFCSLIILRCRIILSRNYAAIVINGIYFWCKSKNWSWPSAALLQYTLTFKKLGYAVIDGVNDYGKLLLMHDAIRSGFRTHR